jgi:hypothetical protein
MIFYRDGKKIRPGEDESLDDTINPILNFKNVNYVPTKAELLEVDNPD